MSGEVKQLPADWSKDLGIEVLDADGWRADGQPWGLAITEGDFRRRAAMSTMREVATPAPLDPGTCAHGTTAEDLCNAMPAKVELDAMWAAWKSLTPAEQRGWLEGGEGKVPTPAKIQLATALMPLHDAPDIENVPAASSMHTLMECVTEIYHGVRQIQEALSPDTMAERMRAMVPTAMALMEEAYPTPVPALPTQDDGREAAPLDPSKVKAGDTVTVTVLADGMRREATVHGEAWAAEDGLRVGTVHLLADAVRLTDHQPAPDPDPVWEPGTVGTAAVKGRFGRVRVMRLHECPTDKTHHWVEESGLIPDDSHVTDVRPLVVIDPASVDVDELASIIAGEYGHEDDVTRALDTVRVILGELGIEAS